ncbi:cysteine/serine-rich nuclear protein 1-like isoform X2 [Esox lucius]|uniref:cysteine/serine-rich nuclear protein 1-like isoform X2 n=1 Tax=Esox lucius TaxID=8010 RepID=UPI000577D013|nr:cysteine/serine-rich nuclear protein 1-like isoform X2 [Esox lucius]
MSEVLKRKFSEVEEEDPAYIHFSPSPPPPSSSSSSSLSSLATSEWESEGESSHSENNFSPASPSSQLPARSILKRPRLSQDNDRRANSVAFNQVTVFLFRRCQGFTSVPSRGGATLGMARQHSALRRYTLAEHAQERRRKLRKRLRNRLMASGTMDQDGANRLTVDHVSDDDIEAQLPEADPEEGEDGGDGGFLYPYASRQRQALLRAAGVRHIDREEKRELQALRRSREDCGCDCRGFCEPETCACSLNGIKCQMDRSSFPCGCTKDSCGNTNGRVEFNSRRVQTHYIHTVMRLELEQRLQDETLTKGRDLEENQEGLQPLQGQCQQDSVQEERCPFGFTLEEEGLPLSVSTRPTFHFSPELCEVGENSCSSDMTDSSGYSAQSEDSDTGGSPQQHQPLLDVDEGGLARVLSFRDSDNDDCSMGSERDARPVRQPSPPLPRCLGSFETSYSLCEDTTGPSALSNTPSSHTSNAYRHKDETRRHTDNSVSISSFMTDYLDENANQATALFADSPLQDYPNTPSPSIDYSSCSYMDLSLSSNSDLELFDNFPTDYSSGPLHNSFKGHKHPDNFLHLQVLSSANVQQFNEPAGTCLLESLMGLSETTDTPSFQDSQLLEQVIQ